MEKPMSHEPRNVGSPHDHAVDDHEHSHGHCCVVRSGVVSRPDPMPTCSDHRLEFVERGSTAKTILSCFDAEFVAAISYKRNRVRGGLGSRNARPVTRSRTLPKQGEKWPAVTSNG